MSPRLAEAGDLDGVTDLERRAFRKPWNRSLLEAEIALSISRIFVLCDDSGLVVAYAAFRLLPPDSELLRLAVAPEWRRQGLAGVLASAGLAALEAAGARHCTLEVGSSNAAALQLYRALRFRQVALRRRYYDDGSDALILCRALTESVSLPPKDG